MLPSSYLRDEVFNSFSKPANQSCVNRSDFLSCEELCWRTVIGTYSNDIFMLHNSCNHSTLLSTV